jgi:1-deoxy-D-xylulose-5-phosphate reductoisomerase
MKRRISILGVTGSVGRSTVDVVLRHPDSFEVVAVVGGRDAAALAATARQVGARFAALADEAGAGDLAGALSGSGIASGGGSQAVADAVDLDTDIVLAAISGAAGLGPTFRAMQPGRSLALANKECLVSAGAAFMKRARELGVPVLPVDSEHNALQQALASGMIEDVVSLTLTASGGPFRTWSAQEIAAATPAQALKHPNWSMGAKITIDSATLMNKGLEVIEAHHLFAVEAARLDIVVHPQSIVHGLVYWCDGSITAGLAAPDMRVPILNALAPAPRRLDFDAPRLNLGEIGTLTFEPADTARFPCLAIALAALAEGGAFPTIMNAANEVAVAAFIEGRIGFLDIASCVDAVCTRLVSRYAHAPDHVEEALAIDADARSAARDVLQRSGAVAQYGA